ncbi:nuclear transport factor 2 family protein [Actinomycetospora aeridis]|uniref:Nuclear transport factor 2 family protein n=1 Tax=Actinomycetospora aeridis TaxID=3129231 RepID=A0ABU8N529_9PSEU
MNPTQQSSDVAIVQDAYRAFARGDIPSVLAVLDPQVAWTEAAGSAYAGTHVGPDAVLMNVFVRLGEDWQTFLPTPSEIFDAGSAVIVLGRFDGVHRTTSRSMTSRFAHVFRLTAGRVVAFESINDTHEVRQAMA